MKKYRTQFKEKNGNEVRYTFNAIDMKEAEKMCSKYELIEEIKEMKVDLILCTKCKAPIEIEEGFVKCTSCNQEHFLFKKHERTIINRNGLVTMIPFELEYGFNPKDLHVNLQDF